MSQAFNYGIFGISLKDRTARVLNNGTLALSSSTFPQVGRGVAALLSLPVSTLTSQYKNKFAYVQSFTVTQRQMLDSVQRATGTTDRDWKIESADVDEQIKGGREKMAKGDMSGMMEVAMGNYFKPGHGGNTKEKSSNAALGLKEEDLDEVVKRVVAEFEAKKGSNEEDPSEAVKRAVADLEAKK